jgi:phenylpyruvate tautomerase PptA (4-oxalocrotonate tautomerase family)
MATFHAYLPAGHFDRDRKRALADSFHRALIDAFHTPPGDKFIIFTELGPEDLYIDPTYPDVQRSESALILTVVFGAHRSLRQKRKLAALLTEYAVESAGISEGDITLLMFPVPNENFSFGNGDLPFAHHGPPF